MTKRTGIPPVRANSLVYLDCHGCTLSVCGGVIIARCNGIRGSVLPGVHGLTAIIVDGTSGYVSLDAMAWLTREHVALLVYNSDEAWRVVADAPSGRLARQELALRERQMRCRFNPRRRLAVAREIVAAKLETLELEPGVTKEFAGRLAKARSLQDVITLRRLM